MNNELEKRELFSLHTALNGRAVGLNVKYLHLSRQQCLGDQQMAVTLPVIALTAHHRDRSFFCQFEQALDTGLIGSSLLHPPVVGSILPRFIESRIPGATTQNVAHENVADLGLLQRFLQVLAVELGGPLAVRLTAHVDDDIDSVLTQQRQKILYRMRTMTNRVEYHVIFSFE